jgi:hypothetical protein
MNAKQLRAMAILGIPMTEQERAEYILYVEKEESEEANSNEV